MRIASLEVTGFGIWRDLRLEGLGEGLQVFHGANESGKSTLLEFVRGVLYGFTPARRARFLPPVHGGAAGGAIQVVTPRGAWTIRRDDSHAIDAPLGSVSITDESGQSLEAAGLGELLAGADETTYANVFAVGLHELEQLRTLSDSAAADLLYKLTTGLDRVSLVDVMRELAASRHRLYSTDGRPCQIAQLAAQRDRLRAQIAERTTAAERYAALAADQNDFDASVEVLRKESQACEREAHALELAETLRETWHRFHAQKHQLAELGDVREVAPDAIARFESLAKRIARQRERLRHLRERRRRWRRLAEAAPLNTAIERNAARIAALGEQLDWIASLESHLRVAREEVGLSEMELAEAGTSDGRQRHSPDEAARAWRRLRPLALKVQESRRALQESQSHQRTLSAAAPDVAVSPRNSAELSGDIERAGKLVAQLRRRVQLDERLDKIAMQEAEIADLGRMHLEHRVLTGSAIAGLGLLFVGGAVLLGWGFLLGASGHLWMILSGLGSGTAAVVSKNWLESSASRRYAEARQELEIIEGQAARLHAERDQLDATLPPGGGPIAARLQQAQQELAALQGSLGAEQRRRQADHDADAARQQVDDATSAYRQARSAWRRALGELNLPPGTRPRDVRRMAASPRQSTGLEERLAFKRQEVAQLSKELEAVHGRIRLLAADCGITASGERAADQLNALRQELTRQDDQRKRRHLLLDRVARCARSLALRRRRLVKSLRARRRLLRASGAPHEQALRETATKYLRRQELVTECEGLERELLSAVHGVTTLEAIGELLAAAPNDFAARRAAARDKRGDVQRKLQDLYERRGRRSEQMAALLADHSLPELCLEQNLVDAQIAQAVRRWQVLAFAAQTLDAVRRTYEREHQPAVLREASTYLARMTHERYRRLWTPLDAQALFIDSVPGESIPVERLSRGTREQIFLCLRLALVADYARRGVRLPMVLDDVLVNFDAARAKAAASVLRDFAAAGHQLLVFTCHDHVFKLFKSLKVPVQALPGYASLSAAMPAEPPLPPRRPARVRRPSVAAHEPPSPPMVVTRQPTVELPEEPAVQAPQSLEVIAAALEAVEATIEPAPALEALTHTVLPIVDALPPPIEIELPPTPTPVAQQPRRESAARNGPHRFTWEDPVDLRPSSTYLRGGGDEVA